MIGKRGKYRECTNNFWRKTGKKYSKYLTKVLLKLFEEVFFSHFQEVGMECGGL